MFLYNLNGSLTLTDENGADTFYPESEFQFALYSVFVSDDLIVFEGGLYSAITNKIFKLPNMRWDFDKILDPMLYSEIKNSITNKGEPIASKLETLNYNGNNLGSIVQF